MVCVRMCGVCVVRACVVCTVCGACGVYGACGMRDLVNIIYLSTHFYTAQNRRLHKAPVATMVTRTRI